MTAPARPLLAERYRFNKPMRGTPRSLVWLAIDQLTGQTVVVRAEPRSRVEPRSNIAAVRHPHLAPVLEVLLDIDPACVPSPTSIPDPAALIAEYVPGPTAKDQVATEPMRPIEAALSFARLAAALDALHSAGCLHGAVTSSSIVTEPISGVQRPVLTQLITLPTASYCSPERAAGQGPSAFDDVWALHVALFVALTRAAPFGGTTVEQVRASQQSGNLRSIDKLGVHDLTLQGILEKGLVTAPELRRREARDLERALTLWAHQRGSMPDALERLAGNQYSAVFAPPLVIHDTSRAASSHPPLPPVRNELVSSDDDDDDDSIDECDDDVDTKVMSNRDLPMLARTAQSASARRRPSTRRQEPPRRPVGPPRRQVPPAPAAPAAAPPRKVPVPTAPAPPAARRRQVAPPIVPTPHPTTARQPSAQSQPPAPRPDAPRVPHAAPQATHAAPQAPHAAPQATHAAPQAPHAPASPAALMPAHGDQPPATSTSAPAQLEAESLPSPIAKKPATSTPVPAFSHTPAAPITDPAPAPRKRRSRGWLLVLGLPFVLAGGGAAAFFLAPERVKSLATQAYGAAPPQVQRYAIRLWPDLAPVPPAELASGSAAPSPVTPGGSASAAPEAAAAQPPTGSAEPPPAASAGGSAALTDGSAAPRTPVPFEPKEWKPPTEAAPSHEGASSKSSTQLLHACMASFFDAGTFIPGLESDFRFLCADTDLREVNAGILRALVSHGVGKVTPGMRTWSTLGWYDMAATAVMRGSCCPAASARIQVPSAPPPCNDTMSVALQRLAATPPNAQRARELTDGYTESVTCLYKNALPRPYYYRKRPNSYDADQFVQFIERAAAQKR